MIIPQLTRINDLYKNYTLQKKKENNRLQLLFKALIFTTLSCFAKQSQLQNNLYNKELLR